MSEPIIQIDHLSHRYDARVALDDVCLAVGKGEIVGLLGPNGSGKTTLFRVLSTLVRPMEGSVTMMGYDLARDYQAIRRQIGVVFQSPSLDKQLTAAENLRYHGQLYGLRGAELEGRIGLMLRRVGLEDRASERVERLSGGMRRRVELAKGLLTQPRLLILDEPSTGLDPAARAEFFGHVVRTREEDGVTVLLTTHLMDEADRCDRLAILDQGRLRACDTPAALKAMIGVDVLTLTVDRPAELAALIASRFDVRVDIVDDALRIERARAHEFIPLLVEAFLGQIRSVVLGKPTLGDVFTHVTGRAFRDSPAPPA